MNLKGSIRISVLGLFGNALVDHLLFNIKFQGFQVVLKACEEAGDLRVDSPYDLIRVTHITLQEAVFPGSVLLELGV